MPGALVLYPKSDETDTANATEQVRGQRGKLVLWDDAHMRNAKIPPSDHGAYGGSVVASH